MEKQADSVGAGRLAVAGLAQLILALATGLPLRSAERIVPDQDDGLEAFPGL